MSVGIGILGFAHSHVGMYCQSWKQAAAPQIRVVSGWDHDAKRAAGAVEQYGCAMSQSPEALLERADVTAVVIGAETSMHADLVEKAAAAGKAIVLQKPMALTMAEADRIVAAVKRTGVPFSLAWQMRVDPQNLKMRQILQSGILGRILMIRRRHGLSTHVWAGFENSWHAQPALNRGMWADDAAHPIDWLLWMMGEPATVTAEIATLLNPRVPDDNGIAIFRYPDGTIAEIACSFTCIAGENTVEIVGEKGVVIQNFGDACSANCPRPPGAVGLKWYLKNESQWTISDIASPAGQGERIAALSPEIARFLCGERDAIATAEEGRTALRMTLACYRSAELGKRVPLSEI